MQWLICGIIPEENFSLDLDTWRLSYQPKTAEHAQKLTLLSSKGLSLGVQRGTTSLMASVLVALNNVSQEQHSISCLLVGDTGDGVGSRALYEALATKVLQEQKWDGVTFHYLFPDVDGHNRVLMACEALEHKPFLIADAGFMYVAKMSGYADFYDVFTPDVGEMAFLADEHAPHPFYTRGFLLAEERDIPALVQRAKQHKNIAKNLIIKGECDYIVQDGHMVSKVNAPSIASMEAIGGTGDLVTGFVTAAIMTQMAQKTIDEAHEPLDIPKILRDTAQNVRYVAQKAQPTPATQVEEILCCALAHNLRP